VSTLGHRFRGYTKPVTKSRRAATSGALLDVECDELLRLTKYVTACSVKSWWPRGTVFSQLPSAVTSTIDHPLGSPSLWTSFLTVDLMIGSLPDTWSTVLITALGSWEKPVSAAIPRKLHLQDRMNRSQLPLPRTCDQSEASDWEYSERVTNRKPVTGNIPNGESRGLQRCRPYPAVEDQFPLPPSVASFRYPLPILGPPSSSSVYVVYSKINLESKENVARRQSRGLRHCMCCRCNPASHLESRGLRRFCRIPAQTLSCCVTPAPR
jgi:hypothetical protein